MMQGEECAICLDMGTTRTRAWLVHNGTIQARYIKDFGVRDNAIASDARVVEERLGALLLEFMQSNCAGSGTCHPSFIAAAGMIGSPSGLMNVPHVPAPARVEDLSSATMVIHNSSISSLPIFIVPGVRTEAKANGIEGIESGDVMRGEESLCVGLLQRGKLHPGDAVLNLGSHWKWILIGKDGAIVKSRTSLTGELIHAVQAHTLLGSALPQLKPDRLDSDWLERGAREAKREGLTRALFCVRLLELANAGTPDDRLSYLYGAVLETEISAVLKSAFAATLSRVVVVGSPALSSAWESRMKSIGWDAVALSESEVEQAYLDGLLAIVQLSNSLRSGRFPS
jgi:2-dehydro-3-deoxygalactonokinase